LKRVRVDVQRIKKIIGRSPDWADCMMMRMLLGNQVASQDIEAIEAFPRPQITSQGFSYKKKARFT